MADTTLNIVLKGDSTGSGGSVGGGVTTSLAMGSQSSGIGVGGIAAAVFLGGMATAIVTGTIGLLKSGYDAIVDKVKQSIDQLQRYSGTVAQSIAQAEIRRVNVQLERDSKVGQDIATFVEQQSRAETALEGIWTTLIRAFAPIINDIQSLLTLLLEGFKDAVVPLGEIIREWYASFRKSIAEFTGLLVASGWLPGALERVLKDFQTWLNNELNSDFDGGQIRQLQDFLQSVTSMSPQPTPGRNLGGTAPVFF